MKPLKILFVMCIMLGFAITAQSQDKGKQVERPFKGTFYATVVGQVSSTVEILAISGNATHMGDITGTMYFDQTNIVSIPTPHGIELTGAKTFGTMIAANGDEIDFGPDDPGMVITRPGPAGIMSGNITLKPGSGRFSNCSGVITTSGIFDMGKDYAMYTVEGWIKY